MALIPEIALERVSWETAKRRMDWRQGEHVTLIGATGAGKTELMIDLLTDRKWVIFLGTKRIDPTQDILEKLGFRRSYEGIVNHQISARWLVSPRWDRKKMNTTEEIHARIFSETLTDAFWQTGWTVAIDELEHLNRTLKVERPINRLLTQGRSQRNSMVLGTQRPRYVTLHAYEQATHLFLWKQADQGNAVRAAELAGVNKLQVIEAMPALRKHDVLYVNTDTGEMFITNTRWRSD